MTRAEAADSPAPQRIVDREMVGTSRLLRDALVRVHPSFRFEERLAGRLAQEALVAAQAGYGNGSADAEPVPFPELVALTLPAAMPPSTSGGMTRPAWWQARQAIDLAGRMPRRVLIGGAIASGVSLAGAALLARRWRGIA